MDSFSYEPLNLRGSEFRLIHLLKGDYADDIECELFHAVLGADDSIPYEALSYTWGSTHTTATILLNNRFMNVTENLFVALQHLRYADTHRVLWIDAVCIDQGNPRERSHQVNQMRDIYQRAEQVVVWLGLGTPETSLIMSYMKQLHKQIIDVPSGWKDAAMCSMMGEGSISSQEAMQNLLDRPWFRRIWIVQEIASARSAVIHCGRQRVSAQTFAQVPALLSVQPNLRCQALLDVMPGFSRAESWWSQGRDLYSLLLKFRENEATVARDKVYALLGISTPHPSATETLKADYSKSEQQLVRATLRYLVAPLQLDAMLYEAIEWDVRDLLQNLEIFRDIIEQNDVGKKEVAVLNQVVLILGTSISYNASGNIQPAFDRIIHHMDEARGFQVTKTFTASQEPPWRRTRAPDIHDIILWLILTTKRAAGYDAFMNKLLSAFDSRLHREIYGRTLLSQAAQWGSLWLCEFLLAWKEVEPDIADSDGKTPLAYAVAAGDPDLCRVFLESRPTTAEEKEVVQTFLILPQAVDCDWETTNLLLQYKSARFDFESGAFLDILKQAISQGRCDFWGNLLLRDDFKLDVTSIFDTEPSSAAGMSGYLEVVKTIIITSGDYLLHSADGLGRTFLSYASEKGLLEVMEFLLTHDNVRADLRDNLGRTPLSYAAAKGHFAAVHFLLDHPAVLPDTQDTAGRSPLSYAAEYGFEDVVKELLLRDVDCHREDTNGRTPTWYAAAEGRTQVVRLLLGRQPFKPIAKHIGGENHSKPTQDTAFYPYGGTRGPGPILHYSFEEFTNTPLGIALSKRHADTVLFLLEQEPYRRLYEDTSSEQQLQREWLRSYAHDGGPQGYFNIFEVLVWKEAWLVKQMKLDPKERRDFDPELDAKPLFGRRRRQ